MGSGGDIKAQKISQFSQFSIFMGVVEVLVNLLFGASKVATSLLPKQILGELDGVCHDCSLLPHTLPLLLCHCALRRTMVFFFMMLQRSFKAALFSPLASLLLPP